MVGLKDKSLVHGRDGCFDQGFYFSVVFGADGRDIGELPSVVNIDRKTKASTDFRYFCEACRPRTQAVVVIRNLESGATSTKAIELSEVTKALQQLDPVWEVLYPDEQSRILELPVETITVSKGSVDIHFRANGIEQIVGELSPMSERTDDKIQTN